MDINRNRFIQQSTESKTNWVLIGVVILIVIIIIIVIVYFVRRPSSGNGSSGKKELPSLDALEKKVQEFQKGNAAANKQDLKCYTQILYDNLKLNVDVDDVYNILQSGGITANNYKDGLLSSISILSKALDKEKCEVYQKLKDYNNYKLISDDTIFNPEGLEKVFKTYKDPVGANYTEYSFITLVQFLSNLYKEGMINVILPKSNNLKTLNKQLIDSNAFSDDATTDSGDPINPIIPIIPDSGIESTTPSVQMKLKNKLAPYAAKELEDLMLYRIQEVFPSRLKDMGDNFNFIAKLLTGNILLITLQKGLAYTINLLANNTIINSNEVMKEINSGNIENIWTIFINSTYYNDTSSKMFDILIRSVINESILPFIMNYKINKVLNGIRVGIDFIFNTKNYPTNTPNYSTNTPNYSTNTPNYPTNTPNYPTEIPQYSSQIEEYIKNIITQIKDGIFDVLSKYSNKLGLEVSKLEIEKLKSFLYDYAENPIKTLENLNKYEINDVNWNDLWDEILKILFDIINSNLNDIKNNFGFNNNIIDQSKNIINNYLV
jgi:hypothetical protein